MERFPFVNTQEMAVHRRVCRRIWIPWRE